METQNREEMYDLSTITRDQLLLFLTTAKGEVVKYIHTNEYKIWT